MGRVPLSVVDSPRGADIHAAFAGAARCLVDMVGIPVKFDGIHRADALALGAVHAIVRIDIVLAASGDVAARYLIQIIHFIHNSSPFPVMVSFVY